LHLEPGSVLLFMSNGDLGGSLQAIENSFLEKNF